MAITIRRCAVSAAQRASARAATVSSGITNVRSSPTGRHGSVTAPPFAFTASGLAAGPMPHGAAAQESESSRECERGHSRERAFPPRRPGGLSLQFNAIPFDIPRPKFLQFGYCSRVTNIPDQARFHFRPLRRIPRIYAWVVLPNLDLCGELSAVPADSVRKRASLRNTDSSFPECKVSRWLAGLHWLPALGSGDFGGFLLHTDRQWSSVADRRSDVRRRKRAWIPRQHHRKFFSPMPFAVEHNGLPINPGASTPWPAANTCDGRPGGLESSHQSAQKKRTRKPACNPSGNPGNSFFPSITPCWRKMNASNHNPRPDILKPRAAWHVAIERDLTPCTGANQAISFDIRQREAASCAPASRLQTRNDGGIPTCLRCHAQVRDRNRGKLIHRGRDHQKRALLLLDFRCIPRSPPISPTLSLKPR